jgi:hypothetical protein
MICRFTLAAGILLFLGWHVTPVLAEDTRSWISGATVSQMHLAPETGGPVASVTFHNEDIHTQNEVFDLSMPGLTVSVITEINRFGGAPDRVVVTVPEGFVAAPPDLMVEEGATAVILIYSVEGVGM